MIEHYSHKIQNAIQKELFKANSSIKIAVAWFTNDLLFQPLLLKLGAGVSVELILNKDDINCSDDNEVDFDEFVNAGGVLRWNDTKQLMHEKFCIIDDNVVIYGSYNWTNKAEYNEESIAIARQEKGTIDFYGDKFEKLSEKYSAVTYTGKSYDDDSYEATEDFLENQTDISTINSINQSFIDTVYNKGNFPSHMYNISKARLYPTIYLEFPKLYFYDELMTPPYHPYCPNYDTACHFVGKNGDTLFLLEAHNFTPINDFFFTDYRCVGDDLREVYPDGIIWLKVNRKWGLFDKEKRIFCIPPICDDFMYSTQDFTQFVIIIKDKYGVADINGNIVLDWVFDDINIDGHDIFRVKIDNKRAIIENGHLK